MGALAIGLATAIFADVSLRHAMEAERGTVLTSESQRILRSLEASAQATPTEGVPESTLVEWQLLDNNGNRVMASAGANFLRNIPWDAVEDDPVEIRTDRIHLYSSVSIKSPLGTLQTAMDRSPEIQVVSHLRRDLALLLFALTACAAGLGHLIAKRGLRPLRQIRDETARIEAQDLHRRLNAQSFPEELADMVAALNGALSRLESAFGRLEAFSSDLAHEFRTPLQNLRSELEGCVLRPQAVSDLPEFLGSLLEELDRLDRMVEQMLFLARTAVPGMALDRQPHAAGALMRETAAFFGAAAEEAGVVVSTEAPPELIVYADQRLLIRAIQNLLANALRHTPPGGNILLSASPIEGGVAITVKDSGKGIPHDLLSRLGDRFLRMDESRGRTTGGAGLGLAIVKGIVTLHGGSFLVNSTEGEGTTVNLSFPNEP